MVLVLTLAVSGCGVGTEDTPTVLDGGPEVAIAPPSPVTDPSSGEAADAAIYLVRAERLVRVSRTDAATVGAGGPIESLLAGPTAAEAGSGLTTAIPSSTQLVGLEIVDAAATVDLSAGFAAVGGLEEILAVGQIVLTLADAGEVQSVTFALDGQPTAVPVDNGALTTRPVGAGDYDELLG